MLTEACSLICESNFRSTREHCAVILKSVHVLLTWKLVPRFSKTNWLSLIGVLYLLMFKKLFFPKSAFLSRHFNESLLLPTFRTARSILLFSLIYLMYSLD